MARLWETGPRLPNDGGRYISVYVVEAVFHRDDWTCQYCGNPGDTLDHIYPWANGGSEHPTNLVVACQQCNSIAGLRVFTEFMRKKAYILARRIELYGEGAL